MKFFIVAPPIRAEIVNADEWQDAARSIGLKSGQTEHGLVARFPTGGGIGLFCYEYALRIAPDKQRYFSIGRMLIGGAAVLYQFDAMGETVDFTETPPPVLFYTDAHQVEESIRVGAINRPMVAINNQILWKWPERTVDDSIISRMREHGTL